MKALTYRSLKNNATILITYVMGKIGLLRDININNCHMIFKPICDISDIKEMELRNEAFKIQKEYLLKYSHLEKSEIFKKVHADKKYFVCMALATRDIVELEINGICTYEGFKQLDFLLKYGYKATDMRDITFSQFKDPLKKDRQKFTFGNLKIKTITKLMISNKVAQYLEAYTELSTFALASIAMLDKDLQKNIVSVANTNECKDTYLVGLLRKLEVTM